MDKRREDDEMAQEFRGAAGQEKVSDFIMQFYSESFCTLLGGGAMGCTLRACSEKVGEISNFVSEKFDAFWCALSDAATNLTKEFCSRHLMQMRRVQRQKVLP